MNRGGKINKKLFFAVLIAIALSLICINGVSASNTNDVQEEVVITDDPNIDKEKVNPEVIDGTSIEEDTYGDITSTRPGYVKKATYSPIESASNGQKSSAYLGDCLKATKNCQVNDPQIKKLAVAITKGKKTTYEKASAIFKFVNDNTKWIKYYSTKKGAIGTWKAKKGNCADLTHLVIALERAVGIPARYVHGYCHFSDGWSGHVWAQVYIDGKWYTADASSYKNTFGVVKNWNPKTAIISGRNYGKFTTLPF